MLKERPKDEFNYCAHCGDPLIAGEEGACDVCLSGPGDWGNSLYEEDEEDLLDEGYIQDEF